MDNPTTSSFNVAYAPPPMPPVPPQTMETLHKFLRLLNEKYPIERTANFGGNHHIVMQEGVVGVGIWLFKQLEWRCYPVGLTPEDLALSPEALVNEIARVVDAESSKLIVPTRSLPPQPKV